MSTRKNVAKFVIPTILSDLAMFLFLIIDGMFVGRGIGADALGAMNMVLPFIMILNAMFMITNIGGITMCAIRLGRKDTSGAVDVFMHSVLGVTVICFVMSLLGVFQTDFLCTLLGANEIYRPLTREYLFYYSIFIIPSGLMTIFSGFARNDGAPVQISIAIIFSTALNIFLDWLFIFPMQKGLMGAAVATGIAQTVGCILTGIPFLRRKGALYFRRFKPDRKLFKRMAIGGTPEALNQISAPISSICMNHVLLRNIGEIAVNSFAVMIYIASFAVAIFVGTAQGLQPLFGKSYGQKDHIKLRNYFRSGVLIAGLGSLGVFLLLILVGREACSLFVSDPVIMDYTVKHLPAFSAGFIFMALNVLVTAYLYSTECANKAIIINILRSLVVNVLVVFAIPFILGIEWIWFGLLLYEGIVLVIAVRLLWKVQRPRILRAKAMERMRGPRA